MLLKEAIEKYGDCLVDEEELKGILNARGRYIPEEGEEYWYIGLRGSAVGAKYSSNYEKYLISHNLVFRTREECEEYKRYMDLLDEYTLGEVNWEDDRPKYHIYYNHNNKALGVSKCIFFDYGLPAFCNDSKAIEFIRKVGEANIKKFMFGIWEGYYEFE